MTLADAVSEYVKSRRASASPFVSSENTLLSFCRHCGDIELGQVTADRVTGFLDRGRISQVTLLSKFSALRCFIAYYVARGLMSSIPLQRPAKPKSYRAPFIYSRAQVRALLAAADGCQSRASILDGKTFRMLLLLLYGTGATVGDVLSLRRCDVDVRRKRITFRATASKPGRALPLGKPLGVLLSRYLRATGSPQERDVLILRSGTGEPLHQKRLCERFRRLQLTAGIRTRVPVPTARLQDLRYTFAVHRLQAWIEAGMNLNEMLPALSAYMGYSGLTKAEEFLAYVPERFRGDLMKLSPGRGKRRWNSDPTLMAFLTRL